MRLIPRYGDEVPCSEVGSQASPESVPVEVVPRRWPAVELTAAATVGMILARPALSGLFEHPAARTWSTIFVALAVQALPFLVLGVTLSGAISAFVPAGAVTRLLPARPALAVPAAGMAGVLLPGCECGSVTVAGRLAASGAPLAAALAFMLSAPAINPVVLVTTAVAFPGQPEVVVARFLASLATSVLLGWGWSRYGRVAWISRRPAPDPGGTRWARFSATARHDFGHAGGFLVLGAVVAATLHTAVPASIMEGAAALGLASVAAVGLLAVLLAVCSEADAFVAASLTQFSPTARLAFMVVGPAVDVKLVALQAGTFGPAFAARFAPATFVTALGASVAAGWLLL